MFHLPSSSRISFFLAGLAALAAECCYLRSPFPTALTRSSALFSSTSVLVVRGARTPPPSPSPEEQTERASGKSAHAAPHELHEARPLTRVSVHTAALFGLCSRCVEQTVQALGGKGRPFTHEAQGASVARQTAWLDACSGAIKDKQLHVVNSRGTTS